MALFEAEVIKLKNGQEIELRPARVSEASLLLSALLDIFATSPYVLTTLETARHKTVADQEKLISNSNEDEHAALIVAVLNGRIVGLINMQGFKDVKRKHRAGFGMSVHHDLRGQGLGEAFLIKLIEVARSMDGLQHLELNVMEVNTPAINLYKKLGFKEVGRYPNAYILEDGSSVDDIAMYLKL